MSRSYRALWFVRSGLQSPCRRASRRRVPWRGCRRSSRWIRAGGESVRRASAWDSAPRRKLKQAATWMSPLLPALVPIPAPPKRMVSSATVRRGPVERLRGARSAVWSFLQAGCPSRRHQGRQSSLAGQTRGPGKDERKPVTGNDTALMIRAFLSGWQDLNLRPLDPQAPERLRCGQIPRDSATRVTLRMSRHAWLEWLWSPSGPRNNRTRREGRSLRLANSAARYSSAMPADLDPDKRAWVTTRACAPNALTSDGSPVSKRINHASP